MFFLFLFLPCVTLARKHSIEQDGGVVAGRTHTTTPMQFAAHMTTDIIILGHLSSYIIVEGKLVVSSARSGGRIQKIVV